MKLLLRHDGWVMRNPDEDLYTDEKLKCMLCSKEVTEFFYCKESKKIICRKCDKIFKCKYSKLMKHHEHFNVFGVEKKEE